MISERALESFEWLFENSVRENCISDNDDVCVVSSWSDAVPSSLVTRELVLLNIATYIFRVVTLIEFSKDKSTIAHLSRVLRRPESELQGQALQDAYAEFINMICGSVNRKLGQEFRHVGMSTPFVVDATCANYLHILKPTATRSYEFVVNDFARYRLTICVCVASERKLDFNVDRTHQEEESGELEFF